MDMYNRPQDVDDEQLLTVKLTARQIALIDTMAGSQIITIQRFAEDHGQQPLEAIERLERIREALRRAEPEKNISGPV